MIRDDRRTLRGARERAPELLERAGGASPRAGGAGGREGASPAPDPEVSARAKRRRFTAAYKLRVVREADRCEAAGEVGALLRREGIYSSHLAAWRKQVREGSLRGLRPRRRGPAPEPDRDLRRRLEKVERENARLRKQLEEAELILELQKKLAATLGHPLADARKRTGSDA